MTTDIIVNVMMFGMYRKIFKLLGWKTTNSGHPQVEDKYNKFVVERIDEGTSGIPMKHHR
jgi:hypothetical protein